MLGEEAYLMMVEEENLLSEMIRHSTLERQLMSALNGEHPDGEDRKPDRKDLIVLMNEMGEAGSSVTPANISGAAEGFSSVPHNRLDEFAHHHHLTKTQVEGLFMVLGPHYSNPGRRAPLKDFVLTSLVVLSTKNNYRELNESKLFKSRGWMHKTIHQFCRMMVDHLSSIIEWPTADYAKDTMAEFENLVALPGVIGAMDTCHMPITKAPVGKNSKTYSNHMLFHSIHLLAVADARSRFTYINVGRPGSLHEVEVFRRSSLYQVLEGDCTSLFPSNSHLVADGAFPLSDQVVTPYPVDPYLTRDQKNFNAVLQHTRRPVDLAFQLLRARWKRLKCLEMDEVQSMITLVKCCCILHNICLGNDGYATDSCDVDEREDKEVEYVGAHPMSALQKRDMLAMYVNGHTITLDIH